MNLSNADRKKLQATLAELGRSVEDLLFTGLTTASEATRQTLGVAFQEASRLRLLRLGSTLRVANEELGRFTRNDPDFSRARFSFFLNRAWLLGQGLARALDTNDAAAFDKLLWTPANVPVPKLEVVTVGVAKKVVRNAFVSFDFRLRVTAGSGEITNGRRLTWSSIFPLKTDAQIPAEAFLHLPHKQKFTAFDFLAGKAMTLEKVAVAFDEHGQGRLSFGETSTVQQGAEYADWQRFQSWDAAATLERIEKHQPGPFDLDIELQEEVVLDDWHIEAPEKGESEPQFQADITYKEIPMSVPIAPAPEGTALKKNLAELAKKKKRPPLFGLLHFEKCRWILQPLALFTDEGPEHLMLSKDKIDRATLLKALTF